MTVITQLPCKSFLQVINWPTKNCYPYTQPQLHFSWGTELLKEMNSLAKFPLQLCETSQDIKWVRVPVIYILEFTRPQTHPRHHTTPYSGNTLFSHAQALPISPFLKLLLRTCFLSPDLISLDLISQQLYSAA